MEVFTSRGECGISGTWATITSARSFHSSVLIPPYHATHYVRYTTGATAALRKGEILTGGTSGATIHLIDQAVENGSAGAGDSGFLFVAVKSGTPTPAGETWTGVSTGTVVTEQAPQEIKFRSAPKSVLLTIESATCNVTLDGTTPTVQGGTNSGHTLAVGSEKYYDGYDTVRQFKAINAVNANGSIVKYSLFY